MLQNETATNLNTSKKTALVIETGTNWLDNIFYSQDDSKIAMLNMMGRPLILYNIEKMLSLKYDINNIVLPENFSSIANVIQESFPSIQVDESKRD